MTNKLMVLVAAGAGYVLGARAGRGRYDELRDAFDRVRHDPRVQHRAQQASDAVKEHAPQVAGAVKDKAGAAKDKVTGSDPVAEPVTTTVGSVGPVGYTTSTDASGDLDPEPVTLGGARGPQGTLP